MWPGLTDSGYWIYMEFTESERTREMQFLEDLRARNLGSTYLFIQVTTDLKFQNIFLSK